MIDFILGIPLLHKLIGLGIMLMSGSILVGAGFIAVLWALDTVSDKVIDNATKGDK